MIYNLLTAEDHLIETLLRVDCHVIHSLLIVTVSIVIMAVTWLRTEPAQVKISVLVQYIQLLHRTPE